jgi:hypothetical protein
MLLTLYCTLFVLFVFLQFSPKTQQKTTTTDVLFQNAGCAAVLIKSKLRFL